MVEDIAIRATLLRTYSGEKVLIPNGDVFSSPVVVLTDNRCRRLKLTFSMSTDRRTVEVRNDIKRLLASIPEVSRHPEPQIVLNDASNNDLNFDLYIWVSSRQGEGLVAADKVADALRQYKIADGKKSEVGGRLKEVS